MLDATLSGFAPECEICGKALDFETVTEDWIFIPSDNQVDGKFHMFCSDACLDTTNRPPS